MHVPIGKSCMDGFQPSVDSCFPSMNLLPSAHEANNDSPFGLTIHARDQELRFGIGKSRLIFSALHEICRLTQIPGALCFIEDDNVFWWRAQIPQRFVPKVMNVLNESFDAFRDLPFAHSMPKAALPRNFITSQRLTQNCHEGSIPRKENRMGRLVHIPSAGCHIQSDQSFARTGNACHEADQLTFL